MKNEFDKTFVIEVCQYCKRHEFNNRHDEAKYNAYYDKSKSKVLL